MNDDVNETTAPQFKEECRKCVGMRTPTGGSLCPECGRCDGCGHAPGCTALVAGA
jgi:hypothetical protein